MPPCFASPATAVVKKPAAISSEAATTHRSARRIAIPPCSPALLRRCVLRWTVSCIHNCGQTLPVSPSTKPGDCPLARTANFSANATDSKAPWRGFSTLHGEAGPQPAFDCSAGDCGAASDVLKAQHLGGLRACSPAERGVLGQRLAV